MTPTGMDMNPRTSDIAHCFGVRVVAESALPPKKMIEHCPIMMTRLTAMKYGFRRMPSKMLSLLSKRRLLLHCQSGSPRDREPGTHLVKLKNCIQTKVLNTKVSSVSFSSFVLYPKISFPEKSKVKHTINWKMDCPMIIFQPVEEISEADFRSGFLSRTDGFGGSVARARAAKVSIIKLTHSSCTGVRMDFSVSLEIADTKVIVTAVTLTVS